MHQRNIFSTLMILFCGAISQSLFAQASGVKPELIMYRHNGNSFSSPAPVVVDDILGTVKWNGLTAIGAIRTGASIRSVTKNVAPGFLAANMIFSTNSSAGLHDRMIITESGLVGIGTMAPNFHLDVTGNTHTSGRFWGRIHFDFGEPTDLPSSYWDEAYFERKTRAQLGLGANTYLQGGILTLAPGGGSLRRQLFSGGDDGLYTRSQDVLGADSWAAWHKILTSAEINGNVGRVARFTGATIGAASSTLGNSQLFDDGTLVGIGTTSPDAAFLLTVAGSTKVTGALTASGNISTAANLQVTGQASSNSLQVTNLATAGSLNVTNTSTTGALTVNNNATVNGETRLIGKVAIGANPVATPGTHALYVGGSIIAEEVKVALQANWPDYVFADDYQLKPLSEVDRFIQQNRHLPGVTPAAVVAKEGLEVGKTQVAQMEKIEELFLHVIALEKRIQALENENKTLRNALEQKQ